MTGNSGDFVEKIKYSIDIVDIINEYLPLKKTGKNYIGLCPFHQEKTPSFNVNPDNQFYYCFGCGAGGDVISFLMEMENITFRETLRILAERAGLPIPSLDNPFQQRKKAERERIFKLNNLTAKFYHFLLMKSEVGIKAVDYLKKRGFTEKDYKRFYLGYAPDKWQALVNFLVQRNYKKEELLKAGLVSQGKNGQYYDRFRKRIIFPIFNIRGEVIAFGGRIFEEVKNTPKYLNSPETPVYRKSENLYGFNWAREKIRETGNAIVMEGYTDVLTAQKHGINNAIASLGTAFTIEQSRLLKRYAKNVYISYDADAAGANATLRGLDIISNEGLNVRVIQLPVSTDPDEFIKREGKSGFEKLEKNAVNLIEFKITQLAKKYDCSKVDEKIDFTKKLIQVLAEIKDNVKRDIHTQNAAEEYDIEIDTIIRGVNEYLKKGNSKKKDKINNYRYTKKDNDKQNIDKISNVESNLLKFYIDNPEKRSLLEKYIKPCFFTGDYRELIKIIKKNTHSSIEKYLDSIEDDSIRKLLLSLLVINIDGLRFENVLENFIKKLKVDIYRKVQINQNLKLAEVNHLLLKFMELTLC